MNQRITIIGGGIAGLSTAIALESLGYSPVVYESAAELKPVGAGLGLAGNAIGALAVLGISEAVIAKGRMLKSLSILDTKGKIISKANTERIKEHFGVENLVIHRAELHQQLVEQLNKTRLVLSKKLTDIERKNTGSYILKFKNGANEEATHIIGSDGIHSNVREQVNPQAVVRFAGYVCWRGVINNMFSIEQGSETWGNRGRFGIVPLAGRKLYWFACANAAEEQIARYQTFGSEDLLQMFGAYHHPVREIIRATAQQDLLFNPIIDLKPQKTYHKDGLLLIGDAAHAATPNLGQGACQAIEDAAVLYQLLQDQDELTAAFREFTKKRQKRTHYITNTSWKMGKMAQNTHPVFQRIRNALSAHPTLEALYAIVFGTISLLVFLGGYIKFNSTKCGVR